MSQDFSGGGFQGSFMSFCPRNTQGDANGMLGLFLPLGASPSGETPSRPVKLRVYCTSGVRGSFRFRACGGVLVSGVFLSTWTHWAVIAGPSLCSTKHADSIDLELEVDPLNVDHFSCTPLVRGRSLVPTPLFLAGRGMGTGQAPTWSLMDT